jgi:23S rRNA (pseudouridine1915-N3)-methyltransferase
MNIDLLCIGGLKEPWWRDAAAEYQKRLAPYCKITITEFREARLPANAGPAEETAVLEKEGAALLAAVDTRGTRRDAGGDARMASTGASTKGRFPHAAADRFTCAASSALQTFVVALDIRGKRMSSENLAGMIGDLGVSGKSRVVFLIGGSLGLSQAALSRADLRLSFSEMTFPHQLMRVILLEQVYRGFKILRGEPYHK